MFRKRRSLRPPAPMPTARLRYLNAHLDPRPDALENPHLRTKENP